MPSLFIRYLPILTWGKTYNKSALTNDMVAALIVTIMLIPQSLAYALLAGLPPEAGLYALHCADPVLRNLQGQAAHSQSAPSLWSLL